MGNDIHSFLAGMAEGDMNAFGELYGLLSVRVFNYARAITGNKETAEDITHDVFMRILKQAARAAKTADPAAYIMVMTRNQAYDRLRQNRRTAALPDGADGAGAVSLPYDRLFMEDAFAALPANQRETVYLHWVCGFTQKETARIMDAPLVTVKWRCGKALAQLRAYFNQDKEEKSHETV
ncbi:MAG: RNA polymerase sigma factor [Oscillospiraceae bacterium]|jgi:RNA polymerase sigma-70 factor (ECF subfamily)|nr:RNA polymerase sigma factor [Oscillospiraceae bacterium]